MSRKPMLLSLPIEIIETLKKRADAVGVTYSEVAAYAIHVVLESVSDADLRGIASNLPPKGQVGPKPKESGGVRLSKGQALLVAVMKGRGTLAEHEIEKISGLSWKVMKKTLIELRLLGLALYKGEKPHPLPLAEIPKGEPVVSRMWAVKGGAILGNAPRKTRTGADIPEDLTYEDLRDSDYTHEELTAMGYAPEGVE